MITQHYTISSDKISCVLNIGVFADIHYSNIFKKKRFKLIYDNLYVNKPDCICIPGDIIDMTNILDKKENQNEFLYFFESIAQIAPVFVSLGSHDFSRFENGRCFLSYNEEWFKKLNALKNVTLLHNSILESNEIRFIGYTPTYNYYYNVKKREDEDILIEDFNKKMPRIDNDKLNILLCHSPICILNNNVINNIESLKNIRLILTGHMHNGMIPGSINKISSGNRGIIYPNKKPLPKYARGIKEINVDGNDIAMDITGGITKIQESAPKILHFVDNLYDSQMDYIKVKSLKK